MNVDRLRAIIESETDNLRTLATLAGGHPSNFYRGANFDGLDLREENLGGFDLTGSSFIEAMYNETTVVDARFRTILIQRGTRLADAEGSADELSMSHDSRQRAQGQYVAELKSTIADKLKTSRAALNALASEMSQAPTTAVETGTSLDQRAAELVDRLMNVPFTEATNWLSHSHRELEADREAATVVEDISCHLIPFLYVADPSFDLDRLRGESIGDIVKLPAGFPSFAEVVMAGIAARPVEYNRDGTLTLENPWPSLKYGIEMGPETGRVDMIEEQMRDALLEKVGCTGLYRGDQVKEKDASIRQRLLHALQENERRLYYLPKMPELPAEADTFRAVLQRIAARYPELAVIELDGKLFDEHLTLFDQLRRLFRLLEA